MMPLQCPLLQDPSLGLQEDFRAYLLLLRHKSAFEGLGWRIYMQFVTVILMLLVETAGN